MVNIVTCNIVMLNIVQYSQNRYHKSQHSNSSPYILYMYYSQHKICAYLFQENLNLFNVY